MNITTTAPDMHGGGAPEPEDPFDLDVTILEGGTAASLLNLTDDNCGSSCPKACATAVV